MKGWIWFVIGLVVGAGVMWLYGTYVMAPQLVAQTETIVKAQLAAAQLEEQRSLTATVISIEGNTISALFTDDDGDEKIAITFDSNTKFYSLKTDDTSTRVELSPLEISPGALITVVAAGSIDTTQPIYAQEIIKL